MDWNSIFSVQKRLIHLRFEKKQFRRTKETWQSDFQSENQSEQVSLLDLILFCSCFKPVL
jgi:hypothetical protein